MRAALAFAVASTLLACRAIPEVNAPSVASIASVEPMKTPPASSSVSDATRTTVRGDRDATQEGEAADDEGEALGLVRPCDPDGPDGVAAKAAIETLGRRVRGLPAGADPTPVVAELRSLLTKRCFEIAAGDPHPVLDFASSLSLETWWNDGGEAWLEAAVDMERRRTIVVPPSPRRSLVADGNAPHPLAPLLCPLASPSCGAETKGWLRRADASLLRQAKAARAGTIENEAACEKSAAAAAPAARYTTFRACVEELTTKREALPLGRFKAPADGWLVLRDARSWTGACETWRSYDLATGAAFVVEVCPAGSSSPARLPGVTTRVGRVGLSALREAAWMLAMSQVAEPRVRTSTESFQVPDDVSIERPTIGLGTISTRCGGASLGSTRDWSWMRSDKGTITGRVSGHLRMPYARGDAEGHAMELLAVVEDGFEVGCAPAAPPRTLPVDEPGPGTERREAATLASPAAPVVLAALRGVAGAPSSCSRKL